MNAGTMSRRRRVAGFAVIAAVLAGAIAACGTEGARAQGLADRAARLGDGVLLLSFAARDGVCGDGHGNIRTGGDDYSFRGRQVWSSDCEPGPVRVAIEVRGGRAVDLETFVGGRWMPRSDADDMGMLESAAAARLLLDLARTDRGEAGEDAIFPATLARGVIVWPELLEIARDDGMPSETREDATFWLGQMAGDVVADDLEDLTADERIDLEVREAAVFALSELDSDVGFQALIRIARGDGDPRVREKALFWLADSGDPRALALFEEILAGS
ncbi:MAG TPA: HEAT repeat domain-containing protein [Gemmatimonadota bacterium]|nr:HEAT repeat domain-containing protein [Gemmatimonadota bacterium]